MGIGAASRDEVATLHEFFVEWFNATLENTDEAFSRVADAFHPDFSMVLPSGDTIGCGAVLEQIRSAHGSADPERPSRIEILDVRTQIDGADGALVSYEERQFAGDALVNRRTSSAWFVPATDAPNGVRWRWLHETLRTGD